MDMDKKVDQVVMRGIVAQKIFCDKTGRVLDVRNAVVAEINYTSGNSSYVAVVADVWPDIETTIPSIEAHPLVNGIRVYDGRVLFARKG